MGSVNGTVDRKSQFGIDNTDFEVALYVIETYHMETFLQEVKAAVNSIDVIKWHKEYMINRISKLESLLK